MSLKTPGGDRARTCQREAGSGYGHAASATALLTLAFCVPIFAAPASGLASGGRGRNNVPKPQAAPPASTCPSAHTGPGTRTKPSVFQKDLAAV